MASLFATIFDSLNLANVLMVLLLLLSLHYLMVLYQFRNMPPGPRLTAIPVLGNIFSLDFKAERLTDAFKRSVNNVNTLGIFQILVLSIVLLLYCILQNTGF